tara:strand:+ start:2063 stop:2740 length:678 start_codon:yes stop_codon:yes gene_type:complete
MYISHQYKLIFLRSPKTASSSLSEWFIKNIPDTTAIYTPVEDSKIHGTLQPSIIGKYKRNFKYYHFTIQDLVRENIITEHQAKTYRVISVLREPIDRQKSLFYFYARWKCKGKTLDLKQYKVLAPNGQFIGEPNSAIKQTDLLTLNGEIIGEFWLYENIEHHITNIIKELKIKEVHVLPNHKNGFRKNRNNEIVFDDYCLEQLNTIFKKDFEIYNALKEKSHVSN